MRFEFPGAVHYVTARGDRREAIFVDKTDRAVLLGKWQVLKVQTSVQKPLLGDLPHESDFVLGFALC